MTSAVLPESTPVRAVPLRASVAQHSQSGYPIAAAIDGSTTSLTGWGSGGNPSAENVAVFQTAEPLGAAGVSLLTIVLDFTGHPNHGLGKFRLSATTDSLSEESLRSSVARQGAVAGAAAARWTVLKPESVRSLSAGTLFRLLDDGAVLVTATDRPVRDRYVVRMVAPSTGITALRLEALSDPSLPQNGPGLRETNGNFVLGEFSLRVSPVDQSTAETRRRWLTTECHDVPGAQRPASSGRPPAAASRPAAKAIADGWCGDVTSLRLAIGDLLETHAGRYPRGRDYLARLEAIEHRARQEGDAAGAGASQAAAAESLATLAREALLANPLLDFQQLLVVKRRPLKNGRPVSADAAAGWDLGLPRSSAGNSALPPGIYDNEIALLPAPGSAARPVVAYRPQAPEFVGDVDLHFDAQRLLFSMRDPRGRWQVFEIGIRGDGLRQITRSEPPDVDSYDACYLPDGRIIFCGSACFQGVPCNFSNVEVLYRMDADGSHVRQLGFEQDHDFNPVVMESGRVFYLRWEYADLPHAHSRRIFTMNPDGTAQTVLYGSNSYWPNGIFGARPIPGQPERFIGIVAGHHGSHREGELVLYDAGRGRQEAAGAVQRIPGRGCKVESLVRDQLTAASWPKFAHPFPLSDKYFLVACKLDASAPWDIYLADVFDNLLRLHHADGYALLEPIPVRARSRPPVLPDRTDPARTYAVVQLADIYRGPGLAGVPRGTVRRLRLFTYHFAYQGMGGLLGTVGLDGPWDIKRVLGTVPVEPDGSALFRIPANTPVSLQPLDAEGKAVQLMRSWLVGMPGETVACVGCHEEHQTEVPHNLATLALRKPPAEITPWYGPPRNFSFAREVQPVVDRYCVGCHAGGAAPAPDLRGSVLTGDYESHIAGNGHRYGGRFFSAGYFELSRFVRRPGIESDMHLLRPAEYHADTTELLRMLRKGHHGVRLDPESWDRLITWIDLNAPFHGTWTEMGWNPGRQRERRRALRQLYAGVDEDPEALAEIRPPQVSPLTAPDAPESPSAAIVCPDWPLSATEAERRQATAAPVTRRSVDLGAGVTLDLVLIPRGEFVMGDPRGDADERALARVKIEQPFWLGVCEVTNRQFACFDPSHDSRFESKNGYQFGVTGFELNRPDQPVVRVSWRQAMGFCEWLSRRTGLQITLPTEAQWEYACRAGSATPFWFGDRDADFSPFANVADVKLQQFATDPYTVYGPLPKYTKFDDWIPRDTRFNDGGLVTVEVGSYRPNPWGLRDMHGNAAEWTRTAYRPYPYDAGDGREDRRPGRSQSELPLGRESTQSSSTSPVNDVGDGLKVVRGGSWRDRPQHCRSASRWRYPAWQRVYNVGFRVVATGGS